MSSWLLGKNNVLKLIICRYIAGEYNLNFPPPSGGGGRIQLREENSRKKEKKEGKKEKKKKEKREKEKGEYGEGNSNYISFLGMYI